MSFTCHTDIRQSHFDHTFCVYQWGCKNARQTECRVFSNVVAMYTSLIIVFFGLSLFLCRFIIRFFATVFVGHFMWSATIFLKCQWFCGWESQIVSHFECEMLSLHSISFGDLHGTIYMSCHRQRQVY